MYMPPKKSKKKKAIQRQPLIHPLSPYGIALARVGHVGELNRTYSDAEDAIYPVAHMKGRQQEAADAYAGAGYTYDVSMIPQLEPPSPVKLKTESLMHTPERKRGGFIETLKAFASPNTMRATIPTEIKYRPNPNHVYDDLHSLKLQVGKAHGKLEDWVKPVFTAATSIPVGESISLDYGPPQNERQFHVKVSRVPRKK